MATDIKQENRRLKKAVQSLLDRIDENHRIEHHFHDFEFKMLSCKALPELLDLLLGGAREHFELIDVSLILVDRDYSTRGLLDTLGIGLFENRLQLRHSDDFALTLYQNRPEVVLGPLDTLAVSRLFPKSAAKVASAALLPLERQGQLIGSLHFGSALAQRFSPDKAVDFLHHLASICAVCIDNSLSRSHLHYQSQIDRLTRVKNRLCFEEEFSKELERAERHKEPMSCLFVDVDHFKNINDRYGHQAGDLCLKAVADAIGLQLRKTDILARYGGEEFVCLLPKCDSAAAELIAERVRVGVERLKVAVVGEPAIRPTASVGLSCWAPVGERVADLTRLGQRLLACSDEAMYEAKNAGRNRVVVKAFCQVI